MVLSFYNKDSSFELRKENTPLWNAKFPFRHVSDKSEFVMGSFTRWTLLKSH